MGKRLLIVAAFYHGKVIIPAGHQGLLLMK